MSVISSLDHGESSDGSLPPLLLSPSPGTSAFGDVDPTPLVNTSRQSDVQQLFRPNTSTTATPSSTAAADRWDNASLHSNATLHSERRTHHETAPSPTPGSAPPAPRPQDSSALPATLYEAQQLSHSPTHHGVPILRAPFISHTHPWAESVESGVASVADFAARLIFASPLAIGSGEAAPPSDLARVYYARQLLAAATLGVRRGSGTDSESVSASTAAGSQWRRYVGAATNLPPTWHLPHRGPTTADDEAQVADAEAQAAATPLLHGLSHRAPAAATHVPLPITLLQRRREQVEAAAGPPASQATTQGLPSNPRTTTTTARVGDAQTRTDRFFSGSQQVIPLSAQFDIDELIRAAGRATAAASDRSPRPPSTPPIALESPRSHETTSAGRRRRNAATSTAMPIGTPLPFSTALPPLSSARVAEEGELTRIVNAYLHVSSASRFC
jgi:hypothetical protein